MSRLRVVVLFGGRSVEREVSRISARAIVAALDPAKYEVVPLAVGQDGRFLSSGASGKLLSSSRIPEKFLAGEKDAVHPVEAIVPAEIGPSRADVVVPIIHGTTGEDGTLQGFLEFLGIPYVGAGVAAPPSAWTRPSSNPSSRRRPDHFLTLPGRGRVRAPRVPSPVFLPVKPSNGGSSVGVTKVKQWSDLDAAIDLAFRYDDRVLIEEGIDARELECAVLGNDDPKASIVGEVIPGREFYDYDDKYREDNAQLKIPAPISDVISDEVRRLAIAAFRAAGISGMARVDFFLERGTDRVLVNELNTLPGFTAISMYPKLWEATGLPLPRLLDELIRLAIERKEKRDRLSHEPPAELE